MKTEESGLRCKVRGTINAASDSDAVLSLVDKLCVSFGGATVLPGARGYWVDGDGELIAEEATIVEVSYESQLDQGALDFIRAIMTAAQQQAGGEWCHIEANYFDAHHTHIAHYS